VTAHTCRFKKPAKGAKVGKLVRVAVSLPEEDMRRVLWLAEQRKVPAAKILRDAVWAYMLPIRTQADAAKAASVVPDYEAA